MGHAAYLLGFISKETLKLESWGIFSEDNPTQAHNRHMVVTLDAYGYNEQFHENYEGLLYVAAKYRGSTLIKVPTRQDLRDRLQAKMQELIDAGEVLY